MSLPEGLGSLPKGSIAAILPAAGSGRRFGNESNKLFARLNDRPLWTHAAETLIRRPEVGKILLAVSAEDRSRFEDEMQFVSSPARIQIVIGGDQRSQTVAAAIQVLAEHAVSVDCPFVAVHDAARPLVRDRDLDRLFDRVVQTGAAILANRVTGTLKRERSHGVGSDTVDRESVWVAQTPQVFRFDWIQEAYARDRGRAATDDAQMVERCGREVALVEGSADNLKITYPEDLLVAEALLTAFQSHSPEHP